MTGTTPGVTDTVPGRDDGACGYPGTSADDPVTNPTNLVAPTRRRTSFTGAQPANANGNGDPADQYVAKHFPTGWFTSLTGESAGTQNGVTYPAQPALNEPTTPEYDGPGAPTDRSDATPTATPTTSPTSMTRPTASRTTSAFRRTRCRRSTGSRPNNCSDAHDATCQGNNLSGAFNANGTPNYTPAGLPAYDPEATTPVNYTGGLYAADLFLRYYIPLIEQSAAFADGGLIDVTFDEANPPFTVGNSFNNVPAPGDVTTSSAPPPISRPSVTRARPRPAPTRSTAPTASWPTRPVRTSTARTSSTEPTGPNDPEVTNGSGSTAPARPGRVGLHRSSDRARR